MTLTQHEAMAVLDSFKTEFYWARVGSGVNSLAIVEDKGEVVLEIGVEDGFVGILAELPKEFKFALGATVTNFQVRVVKQGKTYPSGSRKQIESPERASTAKVPTLIRAGDNAYGQGMGPGTAGWFYISESDPDSVLCLSNWHVLCANGNASDRHSQKCYVAGQPAAVLYDFMEITAVNRFDVAQARIKDEYLEFIEAKMVQCTSGEEFPYPEQWTRPQDVRIGARVHKVGARTNCTRSQIRGFGETEVEGVGYFHSQILFDGNFSNRGDSGSIVILDSDNSVLGLIFAGTHGVRSWANPIYLANLYFAGTRQLTPKVRLPVLGEQSKSPKLNPHPMDAFDGSHIPTPGEHYVCGIVMSNQVPTFDGRVEFAGLTYDDNSRRLVKQWLLLGKSSSPNAKMISSVRRINDHRFRSSDTQLVLSSHGSWQRFGTLIELCEVGDADGLLCYGIGRDLEPPLRPTAKSILVASYYDEVDPDMGGAAILNERYLYWG
jgi:hypothetical protein